MTHNNNPISSTASEYYTGVLDVRLFGTTIFSYPWTLHETPRQSRNGTPCAAGGSQPCPDATEFPDPVSDNSVQIGNLNYRLVILGFTKQGTTCDVPQGAFQTTWLTNEGTQDYGCLWAELTQVRPLKIVKATTSSQSADFEFDTTSSLGEAPWAGGNWTLKPGEHAGFNPFLPTEDVVTVVETPASNWSLTDVTCVNGEGIAGSDLVKGDDYQVDLQTGTLTLDSVDEIDANATLVQARVVCTFTNEPAKGTLQLVKRVVNDDGGTATVTAFGVNTSAGALNFGAAVEGPTNTFTYTSQALTVNAGSYTLRENDIAGYAEGTWSCTGATANPTSISAGAVVVPNGGTVVCTITNDDQAGTLQIVKRVVNDNGGTATVTAFGVNTSAGALNFGAAVEGPTNTFTYTSQALTVNAGSYTLRENDIAGYAEGTWSCTGATANRHLDTALARSSCPTVAPSSAPSPTTTRRAPCRSSRGSSTTTAAPPP